MERKKILIVDDLPEIRDLVAMTLCIGPYHIFQACNGPEAIELAQREKPELILLDVMLPEGGVDGFEVCRRIKSDEETHHCFVMMLTARGQKDDMAAGFAAGANDYLVKPFSPLELMTKVDKILNAPQQAKPAGSQ
jgi:two-component system phosphate regulon response regulator PhoB